MCQDYTRWHNRWLVILVLLCLLVAQAPVKAEKNVIHVPTSFTAREQQTATIDGSIWLYYFLCAANLSIEGQSVDDFLQSIEQHRIYCRSVNKETNSCTLMFLNNLEMKLYLKDDDTIEQMSMVVKCPIHSVQYELFIDKTLSYANMVEHQLTMEDSVIQREYYLIDDDLYSNEDCLFDRGHDKDASIAEISLLRCIQLLITNISSKQEDAWTENEDYIAYNDPSLLAYRWTLLPANQLRRNETFLELDMEKDSDTGAIISISIMMSPPLLSDLFESRFVYDEAYKNSLETYAVFEFEPLYYPGINLLEPIVFYSESIVGH